MKKLLDIMRADLITMRGVSNGIFWGLLSLLLFSIGMDFFASPLIAVFTPSMVAIMLPSLLFGNEVKFHSEKMYCLTPVSRRDIVNARFLMLLGLNATLCLINYILMLVSLKLRLYESLADQDILTLMSERLQLGVSEKRLLDIFFAVFFTLGMSMGANMLRNYFKDPNAMSGTLKTGKNAKSRDAVIILVMSIVILFVFAAVAGLIPVGAALVLIMGVIIQVAGAAEGSLLIILLLFVSVLESLFQYFCTRIEYADKEL